MLRGKHIILGVTGGIAAYKTPWLVRDLIREGADVQVVMTRSATQFVTPLTLSTVSKREVLMDLFPPSTEEPTGRWTEHIDLALWAELLLVAPASANTVAKIAHGLADNFLTTLILAARCPLVVSPAMDVDMYRNEVTQANLVALKEAGCHIIEPESGELASGLKGPGRLPELARLIEFLEKILTGSTRDLAGKKILVTAGPTFEPIDPVRFVGNRSSGRMGFALANAASQRGAEVTLVSGPVSLATPRQTTRIDVRTAAEMMAAVDRLFPEQDALIMSAAVADYAPATIAEQKIKRDRSGSSGLSISLKSNPDILKALGSKKTNQVLVGFALETENGLENARKKLSEKNLDAIVLNDPGVEGAGFETATNVVTIIGRSGSPRTLPKMSKFDVANEILNEIAPILKSVR
ncbi:MAG: bifunctional phosphopantothenoylcysteine decarboxylase/phosphopantothenate--cysteine ligase CoaBC [Ignavibacteria bacterium]|nr:bifunctional phosphopantothenoylcysteine decarboxylase/phosphopantothenate--cysteine ligase CoaBC [Ignavibacteria bacterium]